MHLVIRVGHDCILPQDRGREKEREEEERILSQQQFQ